MVSAVPQQMNGLSKVEYERRLTDFETRINRGEKIEPADWMPDEYRKQLIRLIHVHANSEICGALPEGKWIPHAPTFKRKLALLAKVQDEVGHAQLLYRAAETLGPSREQLIEELISGKAKFSNVFHYPAETWADVAVIAWLIDAAAIINQTMMSEGSYGPYARALKRICYEEVFHMKHGYEMCVVLATGTKVQRALLPRVDDCHKVLRAGFGSHGHHLAGLSVVRPWLARVRFISSKTLVSKMSLAIRSRNAANSASCPGCMASRVSMLPRR